MTKTIDEVNEEITKIQRQIDERKSLVEKMRMVVNDHDVTQRHLNNIKVKLSEIEFYNDPNLESIRRYVIRAWGNTYIGFENNEATMGQMGDMDNVASACGLTVDDKVYAITLMEGDHYDTFKTHKALNIFKKNHGLEFDSMYIL